VLNSPGNGPGGIINHLGVEVSSTEDVTQVETRLSAAGLATEAKPGTTCCYALQDKVGHTIPTGWPGSFPTTCLLSVLCARPLSYRQERRWCQSAGS